jgi:hypothetical protein
VLADATQLVSTRETAPGYNPGMSTAHTIIHGLFLTLSTLHIACGDSTGDESGSESTGLPENQYCNNPPHPGDARTQNTCGCGLSAVSDERNPFYVDCVGVTCADNPDACPPQGARATCLWEGDITTSPGSLCAQPCGNGEPCAEIEGRASSCEPVQTVDGQEGLCVLLCSDANSCPDGMICAIDTSLIGFPGAYCVYDLSS